VKSVELANIGIVPLLERTTALSNWIQNRARDFIHTL